MNQQGVARSQFDRVLQLVQSGQQDMALAQCKQLLSRHPEDINIMGLQGAVLAQTGRHEQAEQVLRRVTELAPGFAKPFEDLGLLLLKQERAGEAVEMLSKAVRLDPALEAAQFSLGRALAATGRGKEADEAFEASFALNPVRKMMALATEHHRAGRLREAEKLCRRVLQEDNRHVDALRMLGLIAAAAGDLAEARYLLRKSLEIAPDNVPAVFDLGRVLKEMDEYQEAITLYRGLIERRPENAKAHFRLASVLGPAAQTEASVRAYQRCLELTPDHPGALLGLGHMLKTLGRQDEAIKAYHDCIAARPGNGETYYSLANLKTYRFTDAEVQQMAAELQRPDLEPSSEVNFLFALAMAHEARGDYETAWNYFERGNARQRMLVQYDPVSTEVTNDTLVSFFTPAFFEKVAGQGCQDPSPIFILGMPRSGSTLLEQIIASHSMVEGTAELPYIGRLTTSMNRNSKSGLAYPELLNELEPVHLEQLGRDYLRSAMMHRVEGKPRFIDKMPNNFPCIGFIQTILPNARIIDARRHPMDACLGNLKQLYARGQTFSYDQTDIGEYYLQYIRMMDHWEQVLPGKVLTVQYEDTVADLESQVRRILEFLELPWEEACLNYHQTDRAIRTASSEQVRQPIYGSSVGRWRRYEDKLTEMREVLQPLAERYPF